MAKPCLLVLVIAALFTDLASTSSAFLVAPRIPSAVRCGVINQGSRRTRTYRRSWGTDEFSGISTTSASGPTRQLGMAIANPPHAPSPDKEKRDGKKKKGNDDDEEDGGGRRFGLFRDKSGRPKTVRLVTTMQEYKKHVADVSDRLVVVRFFATWCRTCKAIEPSFYRLSSTYPNVAFVEVPVTRENAFLLEGLGVSTFPFAHIYHPDAGLVEEMKISRRNFKNLETSLLSYVLGFCEVPDDDMSSGCGSAGEGPMNDLYVEQDLGDSDDSIFG